MKKHGVGTTRQAQSARWHSSQGRTVLTKRLELRCLAPTTHASGSPSLCENVKLVMVRALEAGALLF